MEASRRGVVITGAAVPGDHARAAGVIVVFTPALVSMAGRRRRQWENGGGRGCVAVGSHCVGLMEYEAVEEGGGIYRAIVNKAQGR